MQVLADADRSRIADYRAAEEARIEGVHRRETAEGENLSEWNTRVCGTDDDRNRQRTGRHAKGRPTDVRPEGTLAWASRELHRAIDGQVLVAGSPDYEVPRKPFIARFDDLAPEVIVRCASPDDVAATISFPRRHDSPAAIRSGGHCYAGRSSTRGVLIDVSPMRSVSVSGDQATIGSGAQLGDVYEQLLEHDVTIPAGSCPTVGIAGLTLGGGFGILGRKHGLTCDHLLGARVVLADGRVVDCDDEAHADLFWALRGGGGGRLGVVTSFVFRLLPAPAATNLRLTWPAADAAALIDAWQRWGPTAPDELAASLLVKDVGEADLPPTVELIGTMLGTEADADGLLGEFVAACRLRAHDRVPSTHVLARYEAVLV